MLVQVVQLSKLVAWTGEPTQPPGLLLKRRTAEYSNKPGNGHPDGAGTQVAIWAELMTPQVDSDLVTVDRTNFEDVTWLEDIRRIRS